MTQCNFLHLSALNVLKKGYQESLQRSVKHTNAEVLIFPAQFSAEEEEAATLLKSHALAEYPSQTEWE